LDKAEGDFKGLILAGYYTGARLLDLARLTWSNVDLAERSISFTQKKTAAKLKVPIHPELFDYLLSRSVPDDGRKPLFPQLYHLRGSGKTGLSSAFRRLSKFKAFGGGLPIRMRSCKRRLARMVTGF
jgi:integrase